MDDKGLGTTPGNDDGSGAGPDTENFETSDTRPASGEHKADDSERSDSGSNAPAVSKAGVLNRVIARFIDLLVALLFGMLPGYIGFFAALTYLGIADGLMGGRSIGKRVIGLRVYNPDKGRPADFRDSILRNSTIGLLYIISRIPLLGGIIAVLGMGFELVLMVGSPEGRRLGDELASTVVQDVSQ